MKWITVVKIAHGVFGVLGIFHLCLGIAVDFYFAHTKPTAPNAATGEILPWDVSDSDDWAERVVYITAADQAKWQALTVVGVVFLLICGALYVFLKWDARRDGRTSIY
jgi:hypothetical protein